ncbi:MAG: VIT1/CCC1 transporter family protein, partial [Actinomycetota bacterium]|nr:VIT1/CCC1 transporter family protein [Actinomycetota bacterium]
YTAGLASAGLFFAGAFPSVLPFFIFDDTKTALLVAAVLAGFGLVIVGATKTLMTKKSPVLSALENLSIGFVGGVLSFLVGQFFESFIGS